MGSPPQVSFIPEKPTKQCPHSASATHSPAPSTPTTFCRTTQRTATARSLRNATPAPTHRRNRADIIEHQAHNRTPDTTPRRDKLTWQEVPGHWQALGAGVPHHTPATTQTHHTTATAMIAQGTFTFNPPPLLSHLEKANPPTPPLPKYYASTLKLFYRCLYERHCATREIGSALTRMCMRHRSIDAKLRHFTNVLMEGLVTPLQDRIEEWKKTANQLDKDHTKEYKRARQEIKRKSLDTIKLQKKARKGEEILQGMLSNQTLKFACLLSSWLLDCAMVS
ncbi:hypothetical protein CHARACLAT_004989 [Characodon lateralis]|uniref:IMD domain-containing protein n=1 Tax=Characodon lateralis TaxID=208331 RepID=A0ABU7E740_9TELE|nr:hypothetical protein [Characodon lateralis]